jgi:hypothetical protein
MSAPHRIRLRGPWESTSHADGRAVHRRPFGKPTNLGANERVWLVIEGASPGAAVRLNGQALGSAGDREFATDITAKLVARNVLEIELIRAGELIGDARLEIRQVDVL